MISALNCSAAFNAAEAQTMKTTILLAAAGIAADAWLSAPRRTGSSPTQFYNT